MRWPERDRGNINRQNWTDLEPLWSKNKAKIIKPFFIKKNQWPVSFIDSVKALELNSCIAQGLTESKHVASVHLRPEQASMPSELETAMESLIVVFHRYASREGRHGTLNRRELRELMENELSNFLRVCCQCIAHFVVLSPLFIVGGYAAVRHIIGVNPHPNDHIRNTTELMEISIHFMVIVIRKTSTTLHTYSNNAYMFLITLHLIQ